MDIQNRPCAGIIDSHAHYFDKRFEGEYEGGADRLLREVVFPSGIEAIINVGTDPENSRRCVEQAVKYERMYAAVGIHPQDCQGLACDVKTEVAKIRTLLDTEEKRKKNKIVAVGEIGFDYYWQPVDKELQKAYFEAQLDLAEEFGLPVIIHDREAHGDCLEAVFVHPNVRGVFHSYSGSAESAKELIKRGWYISFSGVVTFKNAARLAEIVPTIPSDRLLTETDCPYLTPHPHRGERNDSSYLTYTIEKLASLRGATPDEIAALTLKNAATLFSKCGIVSEE